MVAEAVAVLSPADEVVKRDTRTEREVCLWPPPRKSAMPPSPIACPELGSSRSRSCQTSWRDRPWPTSPRPQTSWVSTVPEHRRQERTTTNSATFPNEILSGANREVADGAGAANRRYAVAAADWESVGGAWSPEFERNLARRTCDTRKAARSKQESTREIEKIFWQIQAETRLWYQLLQSLLINW